MSEKICGLEFTYADKYYQKVTDTHWFEIYTDAILHIPEGDEAVGQISVEYNFEAAEGGHAPAIQIYFETADGAFAQQITLKCPS